MPRCGPIDLRPDRQHLCLIGFSLPTFFTGLLFDPDLSINLGWLPFVYRADIAATGWHWYWKFQAGDHAGHGARPVSGGVLPPATFVPTGA